MLFALSGDSSNATAHRHCGSVRATKRSKPSSLASKLQRTVLDVAVVGLIAVGHGCNQSPTPDVAKSAAASAPNVETPTASAVVASQQEAVSSPQPTHQAAVEKSDPVAAAKSEQVEQTEVVPVELANLPTEIQAAAVALRRLGGELEVGVGEKVISVELDGKAVHDADLKHLALLPDLKSLNLSNTPITDAGVAHLMGLKKLKFLYLFGTKVTDSGVVSIAALPRLEVLCLDQTEITDVALKTLEDLPRLEKLHVHSKAKITDAGLESLKKHTRLFELRIGGPGLSSKAIDALKAALPDCNVVYDPETEAKAE